MKSLLTCLFINLLTCKQGRRHIQIKTESPLKGFYFFTYYTIRI